jgi:selenocysteine-specific elongation factor
VIIGTAGHIDHGKTALVKALTGVDTDRLPEEKRRGITVELGFAPIDLDGVRASVIDVPGHEAFVKTMVAGSAGIDVAMLVVAADEGIMPQTREHLAILEILEIPALVVALTKSDLVDSEWRALVTEEITRALALSRWVDAPIIECSSLTGDGVAGLRRALASAVPASRRGISQDLFRLPVDRAFTVKGTGTVVTGTVWTGSLAEGAPVRILPSGASARVRRIQKHGEAVDHVDPGDRAAIALSGVGVADVPRGSNIVTDELWEETAMLDVSVTLRGETAEHVGERTEVALHLAGADAAASLIFAGGTQRSDTRFARIKLHSPITARGGDRFVLRLPSPVGTIGGGIVLDPSPERIPLGLAARIFANARPSDPASRFQCLLSASPSGILSASLPVRIGVSRDEAVRIVEAAECTAFEGRCYSASVVRTEMDAVRQALAEAETTFPLESGVQLESVSALSRSPSVARLAIEELEKQGAVVIRGSLISRKDWKPSLGDDRAKTVDALVHAICSAGSEPPSLTELSDRYGREVPGLLRYLEREGRLVQVADRYYARDEVNALIEKLRMNLEAGAEYGPSQLRDVLGFSRKYLIPFLEYCDRAGITERKGDGRALRIARVSLTQM